jgi:CRP-like cAMP-binding protein
MTILTEHIDSILSLTEEESMKIEESFKTIHLSKGEFWIEQGKICKHIAFLVSGKLRTFYINELGNEITCFLLSKPGFITAYNSFLTNTPTIEHITTLEDSVMRVISKEELESLSAEIPKLHILRRMIAEHIYLSMEKRIALLQSHSAQERYQQIMQEYPDIILNYPLQHTASYLGITPQHLSRLRKQSKSS